MSTPEQYFYLLDHNPALLWYTAQEKATKGSHVKEGKHMPNVSKVGKQFLDHQSKQDEA